LPCNFTPSAMAQPDQKNIKIVNIQ
jgi:hypothetical protein